MKYLRQLRVSHIEKFTLTSFLITEGV